MENLKGLNEPQKRAVLHKDGPLLIVAGAGAGKTKTITHRIITLIKGGVDPKGILAITFTNKAAKEMRERVFELLGTHKTGVHAGFPNYEGPLIKTFHALGVQIIKEQAKHLGLSKYFTILDEGESVLLIKECLIDEGLDPKQFEPRRMKYLISRYKGDFITEKTFTNDANGYFPKILSKIWNRYEEKLRKEKALDFDDLILKTVFLLKENKNLRSEYQKRWLYIHVDEYQDTNTAQYLFTKILAEGHNNICVVGDSDQNIYGWRGANIQNILNFEHDYPNTTVILLEENYRSTKNILEAANYIIKKNTIRKDKTLFTNKKGGDKLGLFEAYDEVDEAQFVTSKIQSLAEKGIPGEKIAVLYRANFQSRVFEESLLSAKIPYQVLGVKFFERKEVKDILGYLRLALNSESASDLKRIINVPPRGIGKVGLLKIISGREMDLPQGAKEKLKNLRAFLKKIEEATAHEAPSMVIKKIIKESGIEKLLREGTEEDKERLENAYELSALASRYDALPQGEGIDKLLEDAALFSDDDTSGKKGNGGVKLMTVHAAKGLEFSHVFITGLEQDLFPHIRLGEVDMSKEDSEEERRLFYVALTRAEEKLYLSYTMMRTKFGSRQINTPSEFIFDIPPELMEKEERAEIGKIISLD
ncbi:MAG: UvrD-helicase domain-containing protein [Patescibacteria group bacterium]